MAKVGKISCKHEFTTNTGKTIVAPQHEGVRARRRSNKPISAFDVHASLADLGASYTLKAYKEPRDHPEFWDVMGVDEYITQITPTDIQVEDITDAEEEEEHGIEGLLKAMFEHKRKKR